MVLLGNGITGNNKTFLECQWICVKCKLISYAKMVIRIASGPCFLYGTKKKNFFFFL